MENWFREELVLWYQSNKRDLPWRHEKDPYKIWLSEIILQQTQVKQGLNYYLRFIKKFPKVKDLALAKEDTVLKLWQGLGYYSRARNLHASAKIILKTHQGQFPVKHAEILALKGIGDYTAAAISSFAFNHPHAVVDGNVYRLLSRVFGIESPIDSGPGKKEFQQLATLLLDHKQPGIYNQAIMEFGSQYCKPKNPDCEKCIFSTKCFAHKTKSVQTFPLKSKQTKVVQRYFNYLVIVDKNLNIAINKRSAKDIWKGLYEFQLIETSENLSFVALQKKPQLKFLGALKPQLLFSSNPYLHILSHQKLHAHFYVIRISKSLPKNSPMISLNKLKSLAFPRLIEKFMNDCDLKELF